MFVAAGHARGVERAIGDPHRLAPAQLAVEGEEHALREGIAAEKQVHPLGRAALRQGSSQDVGLGQGHFSR